MIRRREFIAGLGSAAAWPVVARAQQRALPVIGVIHPQSAEFFDVEPFLQGLKEIGYVEGQNVAIQYRWAEGQLVLLCHKFHLWLLRMRRTQCGHR
jgi:putative tryptophan/tyrosine transport system substrate-binding protein